MNFLKNNTIIILALSISIVLVSALSVAAYTDGGVQQVLKQVFVSNEESEQALKEGIEQQRMAEDFDKQNKMVNNDKPKNAEKLNKQAAEYGLVANDDCDFDSLSAKQKNKIMELRKKGESKFGRFVREEKMVKGKLSPSQARIKLDDLKKAITKKPKFQDVVDEMNSISGAPDFVGGSGVTFQEYWLDDTGSEKVVVIVEQKEIIYAKMKDDVTADKSEKLL
ncbi:MAG: hypothetical protein ACM3PP_08325 [Candidatus Saccharibacteria bacterium]